MKFRPAFRRALAGTATVAIALSVLTACQTRIGVAATAVGQRLTDSALSGYVRPGAKPYTDQNDGSTVVPKLYALENWVDDALFTNTLAQHGGAATAQEAAAARAVVLGPRSTSDYEKFYDKLGYTPKFTGLILNQGTTLVILVERLGKLTAAQALQALQSGQVGNGLVKAVLATKPQVSISPRYGSWDATHLAVTSGPGAGAPGFVHFPGSGTSLQPSPAA